MPSSKGIQYTIKTNMFGTPILYVRHTVPTSGIGTYKWTPWYAAPVGEQRKVIIHLDKLNKK